MLVCLLVGSPRTEKYDLFAGICLRIVERSQMDALVTAIAELLATAFVRLYAKDRYTWEFPFGTKSVYVSIHAPEGHKTDETRAEYSWAENKPLLGEPVVSDVPAYETV